MPLTYLGAGFQPAEHLLPVARRAEECGFDGLALPDHVAYPATVDAEYPGTADGSVPWDLDTTPWVDPLVAMAAIAAGTQRLRLMTHIFVLPLRSPVLVAKTAGSLAALFPGRIELGIGVGWLPVEFEATGTDFRTRGRRTDEAIDVLRALWGSQPATHHGEHYSFDALGMYPVPSTPPPLLIGGASAASFRRAALRGDGFTAMPATIQTYADEVLPTLHMALAEHARSDDGFHVNVVPPDVRGAADLRRLDDLGVTSVQLHPFDRETATNGSLEAKLDAIEIYAHEVLDH
ncbi:MAG: TIGR03619 family F420-dependent LLM class oxidoreductase [Aeromicrobium sp.]